MSVSIADIKLYLTGAASDGGVQADPNASLGNYRSATEFVDAVSENIFDHVSDGERMAGDIEYRIYCIKNTNGSDSLLNPKIWIDTDVAGEGADISFAVEVPTGGDQAGYCQTLSDESDTPSVGAGNVSAWSDATSKVTGEGVDQGSHDVNLDAGEIVFVIIRRAMDADSEPVDDETFTIRIEGTN